MYRVIHFFTDLQDNGHKYSVGDNFPRTGLTVSENRLKELATVNNKQGKPLIEIVPNLEVEEAPKKKGRKPNNQ